MGYLPSKNFIALVSAALVILFTGWFVSLVWNSAPETAKSSTQAAATSFLAAYQDANRDSDNDGLKDWEEILWKTDPNKADTDGDGTPDGQEVKEGRDPTVAGHKLANGAWSDALKTAEQTKKSAESAPQTLTDRIAQKFALEYLTTQGASGGNPDDFQKKSLSESLMQSMAKDALTFKDRFSIENVITNKDVSAKSYLNELGTFLDKNFAGLKETEIGILDNVISTSNFSGLKKLDAYISAYKKAVDFLNPPAGGEKVPESYAPMHLELMNILNNTATAVSYMQSTEKDPAKGLVGLSIYFQQVERAVNFTKSIKALIKTDALEFKPAEGGYHFVKYGL